MLKGKLLKCLLWFIFNCLLISNVTAKDHEKAQNIKLLTADKFSLAAAYYSGDTLKGGVLLLHGCNSGRSVYKKLIPWLTNNGLSILALDFRGYGESTNTKVSAKKIRKSTKNLNSYNNAMARLTALWPSDTMVAFKWLRNKVNRNKQIAIVSMGCSVNYAVSVATKMHINSLVILAPKMNRQEKETYKNLPDIPSYFISSVNQIENYKTTQELFAWNGDHHSKMQIFKGDLTGYAFLNYKQGLITDISHWLCRNLK